MKKALKIRLLVALVATTCFVNAQTYRLEVGYNNPQRGGSQVSSTFFQGIKLGGSAEFEYKNNFSLLTGVLYNVAYSDKLQGYPNSATVTYKTLGHFLDIPLRINYTYPISKSLKIFGFAGPNINIGLAQNMEITSTQTYNPANPSQATYYVKPGKFNSYADSDYLLNRINIQLGAGAGVQWKKFQIKGGYDFGLNNLNKAGSDNIYQKGWYALAAYQF